MSGTIGDARKRMDETRNRIIADSAGVPYADATRLGFDCGDRDLLTEAAEVCKAAGYRVLILGNDLEPSIVEEL